MAEIASEWPTLFTLFGFGACIGSFLNVCIHRLPAEESVVWPGSRCPGCRTPIAWYDNIPVFSWLLLRARCRTCGIAIAARYPFIEAATGALAVAAWWAFGLGLQGLVAFTFTAALLLVTFIDLDHLFIPDEVSLPGIAVGIGVSLLPQGIGVVDALAGAILGGGILWLVAWGYQRLTGVEGMGLGDVKLLAMIGAFLGWQAVPAVLVIASMSGAVAGVLLILARGGGRAGRRVVRRLGMRALLPHLRHVGRHTAIPFGPFLALGALAALYHPAVTLPLDLVLSR